MKQANFVKVDQNGRGVCMIVAMEPPYKGARHVAFARTGFAPGRWETVIMSAVLCDDGTLDPMETLDDGSSGLIAKARGIVAPEAMFGDLGYEARGFPAAARYKVTITAEVNGVEGDTKESLDCRVMHGFEKHQTTFEKIG